MHWEDDETSSSDSSSSDSSSSDSSSSDSSSPDSSTMIEVHEESEEEPMMGFEPWLMNINDPSDNSESTPEMLEEHEVMEVDSLDEIFEEEVKHSIEISEQEEIVRVADEESN